MPQKIPFSRYTEKPVRRLRLPKIGPRNTKGFFEEYLYALLGIVFVATTILGKAGGLSGSNAVVVGAWITAFLWFGSQWKAYLVEKSKSANGKVAAEATQQAPAEERKGPLPLPPGMKPMIGPQWPVKTGPWPGRPRLVRPWRPPAVQAPASPAKEIPSPPPQPAATPPDPSKKAFVYERPTLPERKPKLPNNWGQPKNKKSNPKKPKR